MAATLAGKHIVVTGASGLQGSAEVARLSDEGAIVYAVDVREPETAIQNAKYRIFDIGDRVAWQRFVAEVEGAGARLHGLVNNAAVQTSARLHDLDDAELERVLRVNLRGAVWGTQSCARLMGPGSSIVNVSSVAGTNAWFAAAYTMSKWALRGLTKVSSLELVDAGVRVNAIIPGLVRPSGDQGEPSPLISATLNLTPMGRAGLPAEVADLVRFLLSSESSYITGAEIAIDGGFSAHGGAKLQLDAIQ